MWFVTVWNSNKSFIDVYKGLSKKRAKGNFLRKIEKKKKKKKKKKKDNFDIVNVFRSKGTSLH